MKFTITRNTRIVADGRGYLNMTNTHIDSITVRRGHRRAGVGLHLVTKAMELGAKTAYVAETNDASLGMFRKAGWTPSTDHPYPGSLLMHSPG